MPVMGEFVEKNAWIVDNLGRAITDGLCFFFIKAEL